jgi:hypothetical protein
VILDPPELLGVPGHLPALDRGRRVRVLGHGSTRS